MKRLLAYLFLVLGLVLTCSVNAEADNPYIEGICISNGDTIQHSYTVKKNQTRYPCKVNIVISKSRYPKQYDNLKNLIPKKAWSCMNKTNGDYCHREGKIAIKRDLVLVATKGTDFFNQQSQLAKKEKTNQTQNKKLEETQIAKAEPSQIIKTYSWFALVKHPKTNKEFIATNVSNEKDAKRIAISKCYKYVISQLNKRGYNDCYVDLTVDGNKNIQLAKKIISKQNSNNSSSLTTNDSFNGDYKWNGKTVSKTVFCSNAEAANMPKFYPEKYILMCKTQTKIAKVEEPKQEAEASQTQYRILYCVHTFVKSIERIKRFDYLKTTNRYSAQYFKIKTSLPEYYISCDTGFTAVSKAKYLYLLGEYKKYVLNSDTQIAKVEPKQEEFKPQTGDIDNDAPVIEIAEAITVNDTDYEFQGKVTDQAKTIYVEVDGRPIDVKNGKFIVKGYSPIDKEISIEAIDQWGNRSEPKIVKLTIDIKDTSIAEKLEPLNPSKIRSKSSNNKVAIIIGIENYLESPNAKYANLDAKYFFDYARKGFGVKKQNINLLVDEDATFVKTNKVLTKWLRSKIKSGQSDLIIFFAGHGLASTDGKELYLLPQDSDPDLLARTALSRTELFQEIINLNPKSVTMFLDTCYSGVSRDEQMLLASARPIRIVADEQKSIPDNFTIFSASKLDQISSGLKEVNHGIFSYFLMKGLEGNADSNEDKKITNGELLAYMDENVSQKAAEQGREQNPSLAGDPDKVLMSYR